jgi:parvulin-like peptidyl-prolyl isomerase
VKKLLYIVVLGAVLVAACGGGSGAVAASVDGEDVTVGDVEALIGTDEETITKEQFAQFLSFQIQWIVINDSAEADYGITVTDEEVAAEADRIFDEVSEEGQTREDFLAVRGITEEFLDNIARQGLYDQQIREILNEDVAEPTQDEIDEARVEAEAAQEDAAAAGTTVCVSHILVATEAEAEDVMTRLEGGEDLGELAGELSLDTGSGENNGILPCGPASTYVEPFMEASLVAPVGEVYDEIVESEFGFHVILVTDRQEPEPPEPPTDEQLIEAIKANAVVTELEDWFLSTIEEADVTVDEQYGTWQPNPPQVVPPVS